MIIILITLFLNSVASSPHIDCFVVNQECDITSGNIIDTFMDINSVFECIQLCQDEETCSAFTHFGSESHPLRNACLLFNECLLRKPCLNCETGSSQTECTCSIRFSGDIT